VSHDTVYVRAVCDAAMAVGIAATENLHQTRRGTPLEIFDADDDALALTRARELATSNLPQRHPRYGSRPDFGLVRHDDDRWQPVASWVPMPPT
jgi:hypothetical protein